MEHGKDVVVLDRDKQKLEPPPKYVVVMYNDDFTPMDFVIDVLIEYFEHTPETAGTIMWDVHTKGIGVAGIYPMDIADTKAKMVMSIANSQEHPFRLTIEPDIVGL